MAGFFTGGGATLTFGDTRDPNSFPQYGNRWRGGQIVEIKDVMPQTDMQTKQPIIRNGRVAEQLPVVLLCDGSGPAAEKGLRTDERNPSDHTDTGRRTAYIKGSLRFATGDALRAVQAEDLELGGYLFMMWTGMGKTGNSDFIGRTWQVHYIKPSGAFLQQTTNVANPAVGAMPVQQNAQGQFAPQHTGFAPTQAPVTAPPQQGWAPAQSAPVTPPNPYGTGHNPPQSPGGQAQQQWAAQQGVGHPSAPTQTMGEMQGYPPAPPQTPVPGPESAAPASNPWGAAPEQGATPQAPYGPPAPPQGTPQPGAPTAGNPWQQ